MKYVSPGLIAFIRLFLSFSHISISKWKKYHFSHIVQIDWKINFELYGFIKYVFEITFFPGKFFSLLIVALLLYFTYHLFRFYPPQTDWKLLQDLKNLLIFFCTFFLFYFMQIFFCIEKDSFVYWYCEYKLFLQGIIRHLHSNGSIECKRKISISTNTTVGQPWKYMENSPFVLH